ncbi:MAG: DUF1640 domain-containing protein [Gemmatimonadetes bacterium]|nr:DUF1640 domain-containing protein [Gemmatimonadota bacterium]MYJ12117.1 DUF1640 domain-containing protein [Gemmatimonadota bacterium]
MATTTFDTRQAVRTLQAAGFPEDQADAVVDTMSSAFSDTVATKADIAEVKVEIAALEVSAKADIADLKAEMANLKAEMFRALWIQGAGLVGVQLAIAGLLYTLLTSSTP